MPNGKVRYNFMARSSGFETITLSMDDRNLDVEARVLNVAVLD